MGMQKILTVLQYTICSGMIIFGAIICCRDYIELKNNPAWSAPTNTAFYKFLFFVIVTIIIYFFFLLLKKILK